MEANENCEILRRGVEGLLDNEANDPDNPDLHSHLRQCDRCTDWLLMRISLEGATKGERLIAKAAKIQTPLELALSEKKFARLAYHSFRVVLGSVGVLLVAQALIRLLLPSAHNYSGHLTEDVASFEFGVGLGALAAGIRSQFAWMMRFILTPSALLLVVTAIVGIVQHQTTLVIESQHLPVVFGAISANAIVVLSRPSNHQVKALTILKSKATALKIQLAKFAKGAIFTPSLTAARGFALRLSRFGQSANPESGLIYTPAIRKRLPAMPLMRPGGSTSLKISDQRISLTASTEAAIGSTGASFRYIYPAKDV
ncbi:MAG: hypothetical protein HKL81_00735 [Acidimicrobiaceae bacterium]|nr:hypothetical protein [Acidimicrobiaceae bacterium]